MFGLAMDPCTTTGVHGVSHVANIISDLSRQLPATLCVFLRAAERLIFLIVD